MKENLGFLNDDIMKQIMDTPDSIPRDKILRRPLIVNGNKPNDTLTFSLLSIDKKSHYNKNLFEFAKNIIMYENPDLDLDINNFSDEDLEIFDKYTHADYWEYRLLLYKEGNISIKIKKKEKKEEPPINWGFSDSSINNYLNNLPVHLANKAYEVLNKADFHDVSSYIGLEDNDVYAFNNYSDEIFKKGTLLNQLYLITDSGAGKGEALKAFLYKGCIINGVAGRFDALLNNGIRCELKAGKSVRFGTKAGVLQYKFYKNILRTRHTLKLLMKQITEEKFKELVSWEFYDLSKQMLSKGDYTSKTESALSSAIDAAELTPNRLNLIELWFFLAHTEVYKNNHPYKIQQNVLTKKYKSRGSLIKVLGSLKYVKYPLKFKEDIKNEVKKCFRDIDYLIFLDEKEKEIRVYDSPEGVMMDLISQNGIKITETRYKKQIDTTKEDTFKQWQINKSINYYELYNSLCLDTNKKIGNKE